MSDEFMKAVEQDGSWQTRERGTGQVVATYRARDLMHRIYESAHICGDPGMQFDTTINKWHQLTTSPDACSVLTGMPGRGSGRLHALITRPS